MNKRIKISTLLAVSVFGLFQLSGLSAEAQVVTAGSNGDESAASSTAIVAITTVSTTTTAGSNSNEGSLIPSTSSSTSNGPEGNLIPVSQGSNGNSGDPVVPIIPSTQGSNGDEGNLIPVTQGSNGDGSTTTVTATTTPPVGTTTPVVVANNGGGGSSSGSGSFYGGNSFSSSGSTILAVSTAGAGAPAFSTVTFCPLITSYMRLGANNDGQQVARLQAFMKDSQELDVDVTGIFDQKTDAAVRAFQTEYLADTMNPWGANLASGYVYITTSKKINELACNTPLTLSAPDMAIIDAYKAQQDQDGLTGAPVGQTSPNTLFASSTLNGSSTPPAQQVGQGVDIGSANVAAAANVTIPERVWNFIKGLF